MPKLFPSFSSLCQTCHCTDGNCRDSIQNHYDFLVSSIKDAAASLPRHKPGVEKSWWTPELTALRQKSMEIHRLWHSEGKPQQGHINQERLSVKASYKKALRDAQRAPKQEAWNRLHATMSTNDTDNFWKSWRSLYAKNKTHLPPVVDGIAAKDGIAESFRQSFEDNARPNKPEKVKDVDMKFASEYATFSSSHGDRCHCVDYNVTIENVFDAVLHLKNGKSSDDDDISAEHFLNAPYIVFASLQYLFSAMLRHSFVPKQFMLGTIVPILKDHHGNHGDINNYRGITISPIASKIFEHVLSILFGRFLSSSPWQFGFKRKSSTLHAVYCLKETINYYVENGSRVFCAFLDASKAFDRIIHSGLFLKLLHKGAPKVFIDLIMFWYGDLLCRVRWDDCFSQWFCVRAGVRQGGILSPGFYCLYVDELISILEAMNIGCYVLEVFLAALLYADDMALMAPSVKGLRLLLERCSSYCLEWDICLNAKKSKVMYFGKKCNNLFTFTIDDKPIDWVPSWTYLGITVVSGRHFGCSVTDRIKKFYRCANAIFRIEGRSDDLTMLRLVEAHCVPILTYGIEILQFSDYREKSKIRAAYNSLFRKIFGYRQFESVTNLQLNHARPTWEMLTEIRKTGFYHRLSITNANSPVHIFAVT